MPENTAGRASSPSTSDSPPEKREPNVRWALLGVMLAMLLSVLDNTIVGTAMPTIVGELGGLEQTSWVVSAYILATAVTTPIWGKFGDLSGRKRLYLLSIAVFLLGSALSGVAQNMPELIGFRIIQGAGAGGIGAGAFALIGTLVPPRLRGNYQGMTAAIMAIGTVAGPLIGGLVTEFLGWRWIFIMNVPLGVVAIVWCAILLKVPQEKRTVTIDWLGIVLLGAVITSLVLGATWAGSVSPWSSWQVLACGAIAVAGLVALITWERRFAEPLIPPEIFAHRNFRISGVVLFAVGATMFGSSLYLPTFQQTVQGASAANSGLLLLPMMLSMLVVSQTTGTIMTRTGRYKVFPLVGLALLTVAMLLFATMSTGTPAWLTTIYMIVCGTGLGFVMQLMTTVAQNSVDVRQMGAASASITLFRTLGGSIGVAVFGSVLTGALVSAGVDGTSDSGSPAYVAAVATGIGDLFLIAAIICAVALIASFFIAEEPLRDR